MPVIYKPVGVVAPPVYPDGVDFSTFVDGKTAGLDPNWIPISGPRAVAERVMRVWIAILGEMHNDTVGCNLIAALNSTMAPIEVAALAARLKQQARACEGVGDIDVQINKNDQTGVFTIGGNLTLANGVTWPFVFTLTADTISRITLLGPNAG